MFRLFFGHGLVEGWMWYAWMMVDGILTCIQDDEKKTSRPQKSQAKPVLNIHQLSKTS